VIALLAAAVIAWASAPEEAKDESLNTHLTLDLPGERPQKDADRGNLTYIEASVRFTVPGGTMVSGGGVKYGDLFDVGVGGGLQFGYLWKLSRTVLLGAYFEADYDSFAGTATTDSFGNTLKPDTMNTFRTLVGVKVREEFGSGARFFGEQYLGLGANFYPSVKGTLTTGGASSNGEFLSSKTAVAFDLGANIGWSVSPQVDLFLGFAIEVNGGPGEGKDIVIVSTGSSRPGTMVNTGINLGLNIKF
jgi:hypothetical protein